MLYRVGKGVVGFHDVGELEAVGDEFLRLQPSRKDGLHEHGRGRCVHQARGHGDIVRAQPARFTCMPRATEYPWVHLSGGGTADACLCPGSLSPYELKARVI